MPADSESWFGKRPPDLSLTARAKGVDYIYSLLKGFYVDKTRPWGVNNTVLPNISMPFVLQALQGTQKPVFKNETVDGEAKVVLTGVEPLLPGSMKPEEYDQFVRDIANFLDYAAEPVKAKRQILGDLCDGVPARILGIGVFIEEGILEGRTLGLVDRGLDALRRWCRWYVAR